ncbi:acylase [Leptobacterium flavescens]|uniref:Acylase n=1 Tax=Leptobacterium flavescens TaxID=472055 RepID=A0A6P0UJ40_9FLAO|nr:acylase [Leptobacterium flavescens]NER13391.1 acylase [Leptobacterium flavescens]
MKRIFFLLFIAFVACKNQDTNTELARWESRAENTTIIRDDFGVPHIYGKTDADAVFGLLYAQCEDDFKRVERNYVWAIGRLAEVEGEDAIYSDLRARLFMTKEEAIANYEKAPDWLKELCVAFADGVNYYLYTHPEVKPSLLTRFEPWMPMYFSEGSIGGDIERVSTRRIKAFYENEEALKLTAYEDGLTHPDPFEEPKGSNGFAISGDLTESGNAMLLINPHTSFFFRGEVHVVSEEGLNAYGAVTWGQFFVYQGFNEKTGWMHTSTYTDVIDEFKETIVEEGDQLKYKYGEELRDVEVSEVTLKYKDGDGMSEKTFPMYRTHHGPVTHMIDDQWVSTALMWQPVQALEQSYTRTKLNGHKEFREMMNIRTNSSNNTVYADAGGNIAYYHGNFIPKRNVAYDYTKPVDGSNPDTDWNGLHTVEESIVVVNPPNGWIQNCNSTPFTSAAENSPKKEDYPRYMSIDRENFRGVHAIKLLSERKGYTLDKLIETAYDPYLPAFEKLIPGLVEAYDKSPAKDPAMKDAIEVLRNWDMKTGVASVGMSLAHFYAMSYLREGERPEGLTDMQRINYFGTSSPADERLRMFAKALDKIETDFGSWNTPWGEINRYQRLSGDIDLQFDDDKPSIPVGLTTGRWGALAAYGMRSRQQTKKIYGTRGNSFVAVVEFGDKVKAKSMLAGGQSGDINSPHFNDQAQRYADIEFKDVAFYKEDVEKRAEETYHPGQRK